MPKKSKSRLPVMRVIINAFILILIFFISVTSIYLSKTIPQEQNSHKKIFRVETNVVSEGNKIMSNKELDNFSKKSAILAEY